jgi:hypothetical protein
MSKGQKVIQKIKRKERLVRESTPGEVAMTKVAEVLKDSPGAYKAVRGPARLADRSFGVDVASAEPPLEYKAVAVSLERFDYGGSSFGLRLTLPTSVSAVAEVSSVTAVADVAGSLNSKYFLINSPSVGYYVWYDINSSGVDPALPGKTGLVVAAATGATAAQIATATRAVLDAHAAFVCPAPVGAVMTVTNAVAGAASDTAAGNSGFTVSTTTQGVSASAGMMSDCGVLPGDFVHIRQEGSDAEGRMLEVVALTNGTQIRLDDVATFGSLESDVAVRFLLSTEPKAAV